ncbi:MAG TPA: hypothetical protein V6D28_00920 [Leptolyngbyaceae cyanobacterium]
MSNLNILGISTMMSAQTSKPKSLVEQVIERIFADRQITKADQNLLMSSLLSKKSLNENDEEQINRVFDALQRGMLRVVD